MAQSGGVVEKSLLEKIQDLLKRNSENHDVAFCVGKEKKIVKALKIILKASSPFLEKEFEEKWETAVIKEGEGIPLPDFDPFAFELFVKLTSLDTWSLESLKTLKLLPNQVLGLLSICRRFEMKNAAENLDKLATHFMQSIGEYKDIDSFLRLSQTNLKSVLVCDNIGMKELDLFHCTMSWAEFQCKSRKVQPTKENIREVLGDCLFEIRFPTMSCAEFTEATESKDVLTAEETIGIYKFIGLTASKKLEFDAKTLQFKTMQRKEIQALKSKTNINEALIPPGISTLRFANDSQIVENPPFVCDGSLNYNLFTCEKKITVYGLGFLGPIGNDGFYDVKVQLEGHGIVHDSGMLEKRIFAQQGKKFYFVFDTPIELEAGSVGAWNKYYQIRYYLKGPNTSVVLTPPGTTLLLQGRDTKFCFDWYSNQLPEILVKLS